MRENTITNINPNASATFDTSAAKEVLQKEQQARVAECSKEISKVLQRYNCTLDISVLLTSTKTIPQLQIIPGPEPNASHPS
jgi:hypothetical protein